MADGAISAEDSPDDDSDLSLTPDTRSAQTTTATLAVRVPLPDRRSAAEARLLHRGKKNWQPNDFGIFLSLLLLHTIHVPFHMHHQLTVSIFTLFAYPFFVITHLSNS